MIDSGAAAGRLILQHPLDNVLIATANLAAGTIVVIDDMVLPLPHAIDLGHKVARQPLVAGSRVLRYGIVIGTMTSPARPGDHVHQHNLASDYIATRERGTSPDARPLA